jgi:hypothetical protein
VKAGGVLAALAALVFVLPAAGATPSVSRAQLALMPLPKALLGAGAVALPLDQDSGVITNADAARNASGHVTAAQVAALGRLTGYELDYNDSGGSALLHGHGLVEVQTEADLYRNDLAAHWALAFWRKDELVPVSLSSSDIKVTLKKVALPGLGADGWAYQGMAKVKGKPTLYGTDVYFREGSLLGYVSVSAANRSATLPLATKLVPALRSRIEGVLAGRVKGPPVPLPGKAKAGPPPHGPPLDRLTLRPVDVGGGKVKSQGYRLDKDLSPISEYERVMSPAGGLPYLDEEVALFHSPLEAGYAAATIGKVLVSRNAAKLLGTISGAKFSSFKAKAVHLGVGDESYGVIARVGLPNGQKVDEAFAEIRIGPTTEAVIVGGLPGTVTSHALLRFAKAAERRAEAGLHS